MDLTGRRQVQSTRCSSVSYRSHSQNISHFFPFPSHLSVSSPCFFNRKRTCYFHEPSWDILGFLGIFWASLGMEQFSLILLRPAGDSSSSNVPLYLPDTQDHLLQPKLLPPSEPFVIPFVPQSTKLLLTRDPNLDSQIHFCLHPYLNTYCPGTPMSCGQP